jgi:AbrB family looped-hinge helix DNA binding protein
MRITTKVSSNFTVVVPERARTYLGIERGDVLEVTVEGDAVVLRRAEPLKVRVNLEGAAVRDVRQRLARRKAAAAAS